MMKQKLIREQSNNKKVRTKPLIRLDLSTVLYLTSCNLPDQHMYSYRPEILPTHYTFPQDKNIYSWSIKLSWKKKRKTKGPGYPVPESQNYLASIISSNLLWYLFPRTWDKIPISGNAVDNFCLTVKVNALTDIKIHNFINPWTYMNLWSCSGIKKSFHRVPEHLKSRASINYKHSTKCLQRCGLHVRRKGVNVI